MILKPDYVGPKKKIKKDPKHNKARSQSQERKIAKDYQRIGFPKARRVPMSGAIAGLKGDVDPGELLLVEIKQTRSGRLVVDPGWIKKVHEESKAIGRKGWYSIHLWVAEGESDYRKAILVNEELWFNILETNRFLLQRQTGAEDG